MIETAFLIQIMVSKKSADLAAEAVTMIILHGHHISNKKEVTLTAYPLRFCHAPLQFWLYYAVIKNEVMQFTKF
ncbi:MAG: hypothetical protein Q3985_04970 [Eubacteriales bacterium]|nr:hypothetical protein [Eubacteriales bacterium]